MISHATILWFSRQIILANTFKGLPFTWDSLNNKLLVQKWRPGWWFAMALNLTCILYQFWRMLTIAIVDNSSSASTSLQDRLMLYFWNMLYICTTVGQTIVQLKKVQLANFLHRLLRFDELFKGLRDKEDFGEFEENHNDNSGKGFDLTGFLMQQMFCANFNVAFLQALLFLSFACNVRYPFSLIKGPENCPLAPLWQLGVMAGVEYYVFFSGAFVHIFVANCVILSLLCFDFRLGLFRKQLTQKSHQKYRTNPKEFSEAAIIYRECQILLKEFNNCFRTYFFISLTIIYGFVITFASYASIKFCHQLSLTSYLFFPVINFTVIIPIALVLIMAGKVGTLSVDIKANLSRSVGRAWERKILKSLTPIYVNIGTYYPIQAHTFPTYFGIILSQTINLLIMG